MGEACLLEQLKVDGWFEHATLYNGYGPTETTFGASLTKLKKEDKQASIHRSMKGITLYLRESFSVMFMSNKEKKEEKEANIFYLDCDQDNQIWEYTIQYGFETGEHRSTQGKLHPMYNKDIEKAKGGDKNAGSQLLSLLIKETVGYPKIIHQFSNAEEKKQPQLIQQYKDIPISGEIVISGSGIGTYLNLPELVKEKFRTPEEALLEGFSEQTVFISGDIAEFNGEQLIYKNRNDNQIKRYGMLVTLDEMEAALKGCVIVDNVVVMNNKDTLIAFIQPKNTDFLDEKDSELFFEMGKIILEYKKLHIDKKLRPHTYLWVKEIPKQGQRDKASRSMSDYKKLDPKPARIIQNKTTKTDENTKTFSKLSQIWQDLLEAGAEELALDNTLYDPTWRFEELGGDSLLTSRMIQQVWAYHSQHDTPAPNDFSKCIVDNPTLEGIALFLSCYGHQAIESINPHAEGLPIFIFGEVNGKEMTINAPLYRYVFPNTSGKNTSPEKYQKMLLSILKSRTREKQPEGTYQFICTEDELTIALALAESVAKMGAATYLTIVGVSIPKENKRAISPLLQISYCAFENGIVIHQCYEKRLEAAALTQIKLLNKIFFALEENGKEINAILHPIHLDLNKAKTIWLLGETGVGKTIALKKCLAPKTEDYLFLPLNIAGIKKQNVFALALEKIIPRWQWDTLQQGSELQKKNLVFIIDGYESSARLDCPNLWAQAAELGFGKANWIITCRTSYWNIYQKVVRGFDVHRDWQIGSLLSEADHLDQSIIDNLKRLELPVNRAAVAIYQELLSQLSLSNHYSDDARLHYEFLLAWFKREYQHYYPSISEADYIQNAFHTLSMIYQYYRHDGKINLELEPSHWETQKELPCLHALPDVYAVLSLCAFQRISPKITIHYPHTENEYKKALKKSLQAEELLLIKNPEDNTWYWRYLRPGTSMMEQQALQSWMQLQLKKILAEWIICGDEEKQQTTLQEITYGIQDWHPLCYAHLPNAWASEVKTYVEIYQEPLSGAKAQPVSQSDIRQYQKEAGDNFWKLLDDDARYHVLPLQHAPGSTPFFIFHPLTGETPIHYRSLAEAFGPHQSLYALQMDVDDNQTTLEGKANLYYHYIKAIQEKGPYVLMGWSFGGAMAYYVATRLEEDGEKVDWVINFDSPPPELILEHNMSERALDMIQVLAKRIYKVPLNVELLNIIVNEKTQNESSSEPEKAVYYFQEAIRQINHIDKENKYENFCNAMRKASCNLRVYHDFGQWCFKEKPKLQAKHWIMEATKGKNKYINDTDFSKWQKYCAQDIELKKIDATHFTLFNATLFNCLKPELKKYQRPEQRSREERIDDYRKERLGILEKIKEDKSNKHNKHDQLDLTSIYIPAMADIDKEGKNPFPIENAIDQFLNNKGLPKGAQCFLLQGDPGSGKSHYGKQLEKNLWNKNIYFPIFIALKPGTKNYFKTALLTFLTEREFQELEAELQKISHDDRELWIKKYFGAPLLVIFDGYDEALTKDNLYVDENLELWCAKAFISCRTYAVTWQTMGTQFGDENENVQTIYLQPFNENDVEHYLTEYERKSNKKLEREQLVLMPDKNLIHNPLLLSIAIKLWDNLSSYKNRAALYQAFFYKLYEDDQKKIHAEEGGVRSDVKLMRAFEGYNQSQARRFWQIGSKKDLTSVKIQEPFPNNYDSQQARLSNRLGIDSEGRLSHITFWEYQLAAAIVDATLKQDYAELDNTHPLLLGEASLCENVSLLTMVSELAHTLPFPQFDRLRHHLLLTVYASRYLHPDTEKDKARVIAAANAISILNVMRVSFSGLDLREIRVPGAYLSNGLFDTTCLRYADLRDTKIHNVILRYADLRGTNLLGADFGQKLSLARDYSRRRW